MRMSRLMFASALLIAAGLCACSKPKAASAGNDQPLTATMATVELRSLDGGLVASGFLTPKEEAAVTSEIEGFRVAEVLVDQGASVKAGQPLVRLDDTLLKSQLLQAEAAVATQEAAAERAELEAHRVAGLDGQGVISQEQIDARRLSAKSAKAQLASAKAQLADLKLRESLMIVRAPVAGRILQRNVRPGDVASRAVVMFKLARDGVIELNAELPEQAMSSVQAGDKAHVTLSDGAEVAGVVRLVGSEIDAQSRLGHVRVTLPVQSDVRAGGFARARFTGRGKPTLAVPEKAVSFDADGASVMVLGADERVHRRKIRTGARAGGYVELEEGPAVGSRVVMGGAAFLLDGDKVRAAGGAESK
jgi:HlyD family secretion protein